MQTTAGRHGSQVRLRRRRPASQAHRKSRCSVSSPSSSCCWQPPRWPRRPDPYGQLAGDGYAEIEAGVSGLAASGDPRADAILAALSDGRLLVRPGDKALLIRQGGTVVDARTGAPAADSPDLKAVRANNRVRRAIEAARGQLDLASPDPARRRAAADAVFKARDAAALPALDAALARETNPGVRQALTEARAAVLLARPGTAEPDRIAAVPAIQARGDGDAMGLLRGLAADPSEAVRAAAARGIAAIETRLAILGALQNVWYGISLGSVLLLAAIGLAITFGVMGVINMAHGEMMMLGAYTTYVVQELIRTKAPALFGWSLAISIPCAFLVAGLMGVLIERTIIRFLYGRPLETLLATFGVSLDPAAGGALALRPDQPRGRRAGLDERRRAIVDAPGDHLQPALHHRLHDGRVPRAALSCCGRTSVRPRDPGGHAEPRAWPPRWASARTGSTR